MTSLLTLHRLSRWLILLVALALVGCGHNGQAGGPYGSADSMRAVAPNSAAPGSHAARHALRTAMPAGTLPALDEEIWVIERHRPDTTTSRDHDAARPGTGALVVAPPDGSLPTVACVLDHTDVAAEITAYIATVTTTQSFRNPTADTLEATYIFPLPQNAGITGFVMSIGDRRIRGILRDRDEAEATYAAARAAGHQASLLTQERPNIFTQKVANLPPHSAIDIEISYFHTLQYDDGWYEYVFPMVVGPRFTPPGVANPFPGYGADQRPAHRAGHDIDLAVTLRGLPIEEVLSPSHDIMLDVSSSSLAVARLASHDRIPNRDFVLRYRVSGSKVRTAYLAEPSGPSGGTISLMFHPPALDDVKTRAPIEMTFLVDCSGSMSGTPIRQARDAIRAALRELRPGDRFQIIRFSNEPTFFAEHPVDVTDRSIRDGIRFVRSLQARGGTMMERGIRAALRAPTDDPERTRYVTFLTDGYIGNEADILESVRRNLGNARIMSFGVGSAPNRYLMERLAKIGRGAVAYINEHDDAAAIMSALATRLSHPLMQDLQITWEGATVDEVLPATLPDLYAGRPLIVTARYVGSEPPRAHVTGRVARADVSATFTASAIETSESPWRGAAPRPLATIWARHMIAEIADAEDLSSWEQQDRIREIALRHGLMSAFTAFVAVDSATTIPGGGTDTSEMHHAVPLPRGMGWSAHRGPHADADHHHRAPLHR